MRRRRALKAEAAEGWFTASAPARQSGAEERFTALAEELLLGLMHSPRTRPVGSLGPR